MMLVKGTAYTDSCKEKLNNNSSTEAELVVIDNSMEQVFWTRNRACMYPKQ